MDDDGERLDWGHEDELAVVACSVEHSSLDVDDVEDAVSLGGDEEDDFLTYHPQHPPSLQKPARHRTPSRSPSPTDDCALSLPRPHAFVHALPPKPLPSSLSFVNPPHSSLIEATAMASRTDRDKRNGGTTVYDIADPLPPGWEIKHPRNGRGVYYYNIHTQESTWTRPALPSIREKRGDRSDRRDDLLDKPLQSRNGDSLIPRAAATDMSYDDRHYRPADAPRRDDRPARAHQRVDSYVPEPYSPDLRNSGPLSPSRDEKTTPPPRRLPSLEADRPRLLREVYPPISSSQDRTRAPSDSLSHDRTRERRQRDDLPPPQTERRRPPERSSTTRPRSPASYPRSSQESSNTTPRASLKPSQSVSEAPPISRKSRFAQPDHSGHHSRHSESRDGSMRRARTDDLSRHADDFPSARVMPDIRGDDDIASHPASDAQRTRRRTPLPPQDETYLPSPRPPPSALMPDSRRISRVDADDRQRDVAQRSPSPPPRAYPSDDRGGSRRARPQSNGPSQADARTMLESSRTRARDVAVDVDDAPLPRLSEQPAKQVSQRRQEDAPRYPRAMLNSDHDGPPRSGMDSRHRSVVDGASRFGPSRERPGTEQQTISQKESNRNIEMRPPPTGSNVKLSGTNNIPIGARNKFSSNVPPTAPSSTTHRAPPMAGSNGEPVGSRRDRFHKEHERPPHLDNTAPTEPARREDTFRSPPDQPRPLPPVEPAPLPVRTSRGTSRFGPPIVKDNPDLAPVRSHAHASSDTVTSENTRAMSPPLSQEPSTTSPALPPARPSHLPPRPVSPPRGYRFREATKPPTPPSLPRSNAEAPTRLQASSPIPRKRVMDTYPSDPPPASRDRATYSQERPRANVRDAEPELPVSRPPPPTFQEEECERAPLAMHPQRALMLQGNGLPPRPPPSVVGPARSGRGFKRDRREDWDHDRAEPLRGNNSALESISPVGERRRVAEDDRPAGYSGSGGVSLLDRLTLDDGQHNHSPSLRERVQIPSKRDREDMLAGEPSLEVDTEEYDGTKRVRRRGGPRVRKGRF